MQASPSCSPKVCVHDSVDHSCHLGVQSTPKPDCVTNDKHDFRQINDWADKRDGRMQGQGPDLIGVPSPQHLFAPVPRPTAPDLMLIYYVSICLVVNGSGTALRWRMKELIPTARGKGKGSVYAGG